MAIIVNPLSAPVKQRFGLIETIEIETVADEHWQCGEPIVYRSDPCGPAECYPLGDPCVDGVWVSPYGDEGKPVSDLADTEACAVEVVFGAACTARTLNDPDFNVRESARQGLLCKEGPALEKAFWNNELGCEFEVEDVCPDPVKPFQAIAAVENAMAMCGQVGYIHVPPSLLPHLCDCVSEVDGQLRTMAGSVIIAAQGYGDTSGDGSSTCIYGTGRVRLFRGSVRFSPDVEEADRLAAVNAGQNVVEWRAERSWAIGFDPCCPVFKATAKFC